MTRDMRMRPRPREPKPRRALTPEQVEHILNIIDAQPQTGKHAQEDEVDQ